MGVSVDAAALRAICSAIFASDFEIFNRVKAIAQVAHEHLGTSSIVVYAFNPVTEQLDIVAMPGVTDRELMRGPTDKIFFFWERSTSKAGQEGVWLEDDEEFDRYVEGIEKQAGKRGVPASKIQRGSFRDRERRKLVTLYGISGELATSKVYLWKGLDQTNDRVGQVFVNYYNTTGASVFDEERRGLITFTCNLIRELLIQMIYHTDLPSSRLSPEGLLRDLNAAFDTHTVANELQSVDQHGADFTIEQRIAAIISNAALEATENYGGYADVVFLIGERLGRLFPGHSGREELRPTPASIRTVLLLDESISANCIRDKKYFVGNDVRYAETAEEAVSPESRIDARKTSEFRGWPSEFGLGAHRSLMVVPVVHEDEVRAIIRLTSPRKGCFLDEQARSMKTLEQFARYGILRLDECRQQARMNAALDFYTDRLAPPHIAEPGSLMRGVLSALGAKWGTFWPIDRIDREGNPHVSRGILLKDDSDESEIIPPNDTHYGIRVPGGKDGAGFSQVLVNGNRCKPGDSFICLHVVPPGPHCIEGAKSEYYVQVFSQSEPPSGVPDQKQFSDGFYRYGIPYDCDFPDFGRLELNDNTGKYRHTRVAFTVCSGGKLRAIVWLAFPELHEVAWWERRYIVGLSNSLGRLLRIDELALAIRSFGHMIPNLAQGANGQISSLRRLGPFNAEVTERVDNLATYTLTMLWKTAEVKALLPPTGNAPPDDTPDDVFGRRPIDEYITRAIKMTTRFQPDLSPWCPPVYDGVSPQDYVDSVFYSVLLNLFENILQWGWPTLAKDKRQAMIWLRSRNGLLYTYVANTGKHLDNDPFLASVGSRPEGHGIGLQVVRTLLRKLSGDIYCVPKDSVENLSGSPQGFAECDTFFEFFLPYTPVGEFPCV